MDSTDPHIVFFISTVVLIKNKTQNDNEQTRPTAWLAHERHSINSGYETFSLHIPCPHYFIGYMLVL